MHKLPLSVRLLLNVCIFSIPILVLTYLMFKSETVNIDFGRKEKIGNQMQRPYENLLQSVSLYKLQPLYSQNPSSPSAENLESQIENQLQDLKSIHAKIGAELLFTTEGLGSRKRENASLESLENFWKNRKLDEMIVSIKTAITHLGDTSNLILDPDLDSYYLMDITLLALPQMQDRIQSILSQKTSLLDPNKNESVRIQAALFAAMLKESDLARAMGDTQTTLNEDGNFFGKSLSLQEKLPATMEALSQQTEKFAGLLTRISNAEPVTEAEWSETGLALLNQSFKSWHTSVDEMDILLSSRIETLSSNRTKALVMAGLALLVAIAFSVVVGFSMSHTIQNVLSSVLKLKDAAYESSRVGLFLKSRSDDVTKSVGQQVTSIEQTTASVYEINSLVELNAETTKQASSLAQNLTDSAVRAESEIDQLLASMNRITESSKKVVDAVTVIDDIAFQTNLLALNASVEAARAGELGRGFAVVADAVRSLAQKSAQSAKEINLLMQENVTSVDSGRKGADQSAVILKTIVDLIKKLNSMNTDLARASDEQASGIGQISTAMNTIEKGTHQTNETLSEISKSADDMLVQSEQLQSIVKVLQKEILGKEILESERNESPSRLPKKPNLAA